MTSVKLSIDSDGNVTTGKTTSFADALREDFRLIWIDVDRGATEDLKYLADKLELHELSLEDTLKGGQRSKIDTYDKHTFMVLYAIDATREAISTSEISLFLGEGFIVTVHDGELKVLDEVAKRWNSATWSEKRQPKGLLLYAMIDAIVDEYFPVIDAIGDRLGHLESQILDENRNGTREDFFALRRDLLQLRRIVSPERDVLNHLLRRDTPMFDNEVTTYLGDVYDHLLRSFDWLETYRDQLSTLLDLQAASAANRLNQVMKTLTASSIMLMTGSLIAGIYGMNFDRIPELHWRFGYPFALGLMVVLIGSLAVFFRRRDWL